MSHNNHPSPEQNPQNVKPGQEYIDKSKRSLNHDSARLTVDSVEFIREQWRAVVVRTHTGKRTMIRLDRLGLWPYIKLSD